MAIRRNHFRDYPAGEAITKFDRDLDFLGSQRKRWWLRSGNDGLDA